MILHIFLLLDCIHCMWCFTINISGETYIEPGVPYKVTCTVSHFLKNRRTIYSAIISSGDIAQFAIAHVVTGECAYRTLTGTSLCPSSLCSCDTDGLATHWIYNAPTDLASSVTFRCESKNIEGLLTSSEQWIPTVPNGPGSSIFFNPADESITKNLSGSLGPVVCSAQCNPPCQFYWIKPDGTVVDGSTLEIPSLSKNDHGTFTCHTDNGYGNNATKNLLLTVNYGPEYVTLSPPTTTYTVTEGDTIPSISCTASCRPRCTSMWTGPNVPDGTTNDLYLQNINRNQTGTFYCTATNEVGNKRSSNVEVDVQYQAKVENVAINTANTVDENTTVMFTCLFEGNPAPIVTWSLNGKIVQTSEGSTTKSSFIVDSTRCSNTGKYICTATNIIGTSAKQLMLYVTCHPRSAIILDTTIAITNKQRTLNITVPIISYPQPTLIRWTFIQNGTTEQTAVDSKYITTTYGVYQHISELIKDGLTNSEYGLYSINVSNNIEPYFQHDFNVVEENGPGSSISFNPGDESVTRIQGESLGPIVCSAQCNPPCQFHWIKPDGTVVDESNLQIPSLSKNDHGTFTCHAGNGYVNNATKNLLLTVSYGPEYVTLSPPTTTYTVTEGDTIPSISCTASCRPRCTSMWTGPNVPDGTTNDLYLQNINRNQAGTFYCTATNEVGNKRSSNVEVDVQSQVQKNPASASQESNALFTAGISSLIISVLAIVFVIVFVLFCRSRIQKRQQMRTNDYTEFTTCTHCNPVVTDSYDSIKTTVIGPADISETQTDRNVDTYEECLPVTNKQPKEKEKMKKKEEINDNMKI